jgi:hypothetical protein
VIVKMSTSLSEVLVLVVDDEKRSEGRGGEKYLVPNFFRTLSGVEPDWVKYLEAAPAGSGP